MRSKREALSLLRKLEPYSPGGFGYGKFTHLPAESECARILAAYRLTKGELPRGSEVRAKKYVDGIRKRESWRKSVGMDQNGVTRGMRNYLAEQRPGVEL